MKLSVVKVDRSGDHGVQVVCRDPATGKRQRIIVDDFRPYFYIKSELDQIAEAWGPVETQIHSKLALEDDQMLLTKVVFNSVEDVKVFRNKTGKVWEADIPYTQRFTIDAGCYGTIEIPDSDNTIHKLGWKDIKHIDEDIGKPRKHYIDIEVANIRFCPPSVADAPLCALSIYDNYKETFHSWAWNPQRNPTVEEKEFYSRALGRFAKWTITWCATTVDVVQQWLDWHNLNKCDVLAGWNSVDYDMQYIVNHMKNKEVFDQRLGGKYGRYEDIPDIQILDMMGLYRMQSQGELRSASLGSVAKEECGIELVKDADNIMKWFENDPDALMLYNILDVDATVAVDMKCDLVNFALRYMAYAGVDRLMDIMSASVVVDVAHLFEAQRAGVALPTRLDKENPKKYEGARVFNPIPGVHTNVGVADFSRMYPSIIMGYNMSFETYGKHGIIIPPNPSQNYPGAMFSNTKEGLTTSVVKRLAQLRATYDVLIEQASDPKEIKRLKNARAPLKNMLNSIFGAMSFENYRLYKPEIAESITYIGRELIDGVKSIANHLGFPVVYGDTDSVFIKLGELSLEDTVPMALDLVKRLNSDLSEKAKKIGVSANHLTVDFEKIYDKLFLGHVKKRYAGRVVWQDGKALPKEKVWVEIKGFEYRRSESAKITVDLQDNMFKMLFDGATKNEVVGYVKQTLSRVENGEIPVNEVAMCPKLQRDPSKYETPFMAAAAARYSIEFLDKSFYGGDRVYCVYVKGVPKGKPVTHVIGLREKDTIPEGYIVDWRTMADKCVRDKAEKLLEVLGWNAGGRQVGLSGF